MPSSEWNPRRMLDQLVRANAVDGMWAEATIAAAGRSKTWSGLSPAPRTTAGASRGSTAARAWMRRGTWRGSEAWSGVPLGY